jgi:imidazolonepropionase-like amidohydrolase
MTPEQALVTATTNGSALLGMEKSLGAVAPGYFADIVAVDGDPLQDIGVVIRNVRWGNEGWQGGGGPHVRRQLTK